MTTEHQSTSETQLISRNPLLQPFASNSIWNTPIGSNASYVDARIQPTSQLGTDIDHFFVLDAADPQQDVYSIGGWTDRTSGTTDLGFDLPVPDELLIPDANDIEQPNNSAALLLPGGETLIQFNALTRDSIGSRINGVKYPFGRLPDETLTSTGVLGGHGGSGLSSIGGTIRLGELIGNEPLRHALKINLWAERYLSYDEGVLGGRGFRWPAIKADGGASSSTYGGQVPALQMGSLLAIPPDITPEFLGLKSKPALKIFYALQDYGAYVVDDTARDAHSIGTENGVLQEFQHEYGHTFGDQQSDFFNDVMTLFSSLHVIDNNSPDSIGGGGIPRAPIAPPIDLSYVTELQQLMDDRTVENTFKADFNGDGNQDLLWRNLATGLNHVWLQDGEGNQIGGGNILPLTDPNWQIQETPDVDQDGRADIVWKNRVTGAKQIWHLDDLRLWVDPETGKRVTRWRNNASGSPRINFVESVRENDANLSLYHSQQTVVSNQSEIIQTITSNEGNIQVKLVDNFVNTSYEVGFYTVDDAFGFIDNIAPHEIGYADAAIRRSQILFSVLSNKPSGFTEDIGRTLSLETSDYLRFYLIPESTLDSVLAGITSANEIIFPTQDTFKVTEIGTDRFALSWETEHSTVAYDDIVLFAQSTDTAPLLGTSLQGMPNGELIDLRDITGQVLNAEFTLNREAAYDSFVDFYTVVDAAGGIDTNDDGMADIYPGEVTYAQAALSKRISADLAVENQTTSVVNQQLLGGSILAPFIIVNAQPEALAHIDIIDDPEIYFAFLGANSDGVDHVRLLGDNTFGFEDLANGGDQDFNDLIVQVKLTSL